MTTSVQTIPAHPAQEEVSWASRHRGVLIGVGIGLVVLLALVIWAVIGMAGHPAETQTIRDIFIIFMALEGLIIGLALVILIVQLAVLTNVLQHEIKPILDSTNEAARTLRGTATFVSQNVVDPVIKVHASVAAVRRALDALRPNHRS